MTIITRIMGLEKGDLIQCHISTQKILQFIKDKVYILIIHIICYYMFIDTQILFQHKETLKQCSLGIKILAQGFYESI